MHPTPVQRVLVLCTHNSARGIIAEYLLRKKAAHRFEVYSAGVCPTGTVDPLTHWVLSERYGIDARDARSKCWTEFVGLKFNFVITVYDKEREKMPRLANTPILAHWGCPDPSIEPATEAQRKRLFLNLASQISAQVDLLCALPPVQLIRAA